MANLQRITDGFMSAGSVLQVVSYQTDSAISTTSTSYVDSGISVAITPKFATSKMVIILSLSFQSHGSAGANGSADYNLVRNTTQLQEWRQRTYSYNGSGVYLAVPKSTYIDLPATTSPITYKVQLLSGAANAGINSEISSSSIIVMEVSQ